MYHVKISVKCSNWDAETVKIVEKHIGNLIEEANKTEYLSPFLREIIISDLYKEEYDRIAKEWNMHSKLTEEAEYISVGKICYNKNYKDPQNIILIHPVIFNDEEWVDRINVLLLNVYAFGLLPDELKDKNVYHYDTPIVEIANIIFTSLFEAYYASLRLRPENRLESKPPIPPKNIIDPFKRKVKRLHLKYQHDLDFEHFVIRYYSALTGLLNLSLDACLHKVNMSEFGEFEIPIRKLITDLHDEAIHIISKNSYSTLFLKEVLIEICNISFIKISENPYNITVAESPKELFPGLVDTHDRIVAFVDVLGFSDMIERFDSESDINLLKDLKESLDTAILKMKSQFQHSADTVEYKLFSDCLCLSAPYFDNDTDFSYQFAIVLLGIKTYQMIMLTKGYLVRGGIAIGSYYSDDNMIFSGALVEAVSYEKNGSTSGRTSSLKQPRILISPEVLTKLRETKIHKIMAVYFEDGLIKDKDGEVFVNPFIDMKASLSVFTNALSLFPTGENETFDGLNPLIRSSLELLGSFMTPESNDLLLDQLLSEMNDRIDKYKLKPAILHKYEWVKEFLQWLRSGKRNGYFLIYNVNFKEIVDNWGTE